MLKINDYDLEKAAEALLAIESVLGGTVEEIQAAIVALANQYIQKNGDYCSTGGVDITGHTFAYEPEILHCKIHIMPYAVASYFKRKV